jgi:hypothetical protein
MRSLGILARRLAGGAPVGIRTRTHHAGREARCSCGKRATSPAGSSRPGWDEVRRCRPGERLTLASASRSDGAASCARDAWTLSLWALCVRRRCARFAAKRARPPASPSTCGELEERGRGMCVWMVGVAGLRRACALTASSRCPARRRCPPRPRPSHDARPHAHSSPCRSYARATPCQDRITLANRAQPGGEAATGVDGPGV